MVYKKYGSTFRRLRDQRHFSLSNFTPIGISKAALSKFERGESMMSFEKIVSALQLMGVSLEEFEYFLNEYTPNEPDFLIDEIEKANKRQDQSRLIELSDIASQEGYPFISIAAKASYISLSDDEVEEVTDFLFEVDVWSYKELYVFTLTMDNLNTRDILYVLDLFLSKGHTLFNSGKYKGYLVEACFKASVVLSSRGYKEYAEYILNRVESYDLINTMFIRNIRNFTKGYWVYKFADVTEGKEQMKKALDIFKEVSTKDIYNYYLSLYNKLIEP